MVWPVRPCISVSSAIALLVAVVISAGHAHVEPLVSDGDIDAVQHAIDYTHARFMVLSDQLEVVQARPVLASELPALGLLDVRRPDGDPPLYLVILRGDFGLNPWVDSAAYARRPERGNATPSHARANFVAYAMDQQTGRPLMWRASRMGGLLRAALDDPTLPDEPLDVPENIGAFPPPWAGNLETYGVTTPAGRRCDAFHFPGGGWCGYLPSCDANLPSLIANSCGEPGPRFCYSRAFFVQPTICGRSSVYNYVEIAIDDGFYPNEIALPLATEVLWRNRGSRPHSVSTSASPLGWEDSGALPPGGRWSVIFQTALTWDYFDALHADTIRGRLLIGR